MSSFWCNICTYKVMIVIITYAVLSCRVRERQVLLQCYLCCRKRVMLWLTLLIILHVCCGHDYSRSYIGRYRFFGNFGVRSTSIYLLGGTFVEIWTPLLICVICRRAVHYALLFSVRDQRWVQCTKRYDDCWCTTSVWIPGNTYTSGDVASQSLWSLCNRCLVGIARYDALSWMAKIYRVIQIA